MVLEKLENKELSSCSVYNIIAISLINIGWFMLNKLLTCKIILT